MTESLNQRMKRLRKEKNLTAKEMASKLGVAQSTYREWEFGRGLKFPPLLKISQVLAISVTELLSGEILPDSEHLKDLKEIEAKVVELKLKMTLAK